MEAIENALFFKELAARLTGPERALMEGLRLGYNCVQLGQTDKDRKRLLHKLACIAEAEWLCPGCKARKPATEFIWSRLKCRSCRLDKGAK
jgi:hypothetical protein